MAVQRDSWCDFQTSANYTIVPYDTRMLDQMIESEEDKILLGNLINTALDFAEPGERVKVTVLLPSEENNATVYTIHLIYDAGPTEFSLTQHIAALQACNQLRIQNIVWGINTDYHDRPRSYLTLYIFPHHTALAPRVRAFFQLTYPTVTLPTPGATLPPHGESVKRPRGATPANHRPHKRHAG